MISLNITVKILILRRYFVCDFCLNAIDKHFTHIMEQFGDLYY